MKPDAMHIESVRKALVANELSTAGTDAEMRERLRDAVLREARDRRREKQSAEDQLGRPVLVAIDGLTIFELSWLVHFSVARGVRPMCMDRPIGVELRTKWKEYGIIEADPDTDGCYILTERGNAWLRACCKTPLPTIAYLDADGRPV